jgi:ribosome-associated toxin RatA of RatAB toxin-antitoxin module
MRSASSIDTSIQRITGLILVAAMVLSVAVHAQPIRPDFSFSTVREDKLIIVEARADLPVSPGLAWAVLTDYEAYPRFISSMRESKIVARNSKGLIVEQKGRFGFLFFSHEIEAQLLVTEFPPNAIESRSLKGSIQDLFGHYELQKIAKGVRLSYSGRMIPDFSVPPIIGTSIVNYILKRNFSEMVDEMLRREALSHRRPPAED